MNLLTRLYRIKVAIVACVTALSGALMLVLAKQAEHTASFDWLSDLPVFELGSTLFIIGSLVIVWDYVDGRDKERREDERIRRLLRESAPAFRDAVIEGFAVQPDDLQRVATPELLDSIATNVLSLRLGDATFASELYTQVRDQAIRAPERWADVDVSIRLSTAVERGTSGAPLFDMLISWEYSTCPAHDIRRFACVSDREEYYDLVSDLPATSTWYMPPRTGVDASARSSFELLEFAVDGEPRRIRRQTRKTGQTYTVSIAPGGGDGSSPASAPVRLRQVYRTVGAQDAHRLFIELPVPARNVKIAVDYTNTDIANLVVTEAVASLEKPRVTRSPDGLPGRQLSMELPGWLLPRAGFTFVWTLRSEQTKASRASGPTASRDAA